jgi:hypothetical protein
MDWKVGWETISEEQSSTFNESLEKVTQGSRLK